MCGVGRYTQEVLLATSLEEAFALLRKDPSHPVLLRIGDLTVEVRTVAGHQQGRSAADVFSDIGPWEGETTEELQTILGEARERGSRRTLAPL